jgi:hypothetical protein
MEKIRIILAGLFVRQSDIPDLMQAIELFDDVEESLNNYNSLRTEIEKLRDEVKEGEFHVKGYSKSGHKQFLDYPDLIRKFISRLTNILGDTE